MKALFETTENDKNFYEQRLGDFLPQRITDIHVHLWNKPGAPVKDPRCASWPARVAATNSIEELLETYRLLLPGKEVSALVFANATGGPDLAAANRYVADCSQRAGFPALLFSHPAWPPAELERQLESGGFLGIKSYLSFAPAYLPADEVRISDFFPPPQLEVINRRRGILMLHLPRSLRLRDPVNLAQLLELEQRFPGINLIVAHVGRAYCMEDVGAAFETLQTAKKINFDISANTNRHVFRRLVEAVGPERILFGSDLPILRMRMRRICENGRYINLVPAGLYGDVSADPHLREVAPGEGKNLTFFLYEELDAFRMAAADVGLGKADIEKVFCENAARLLAAARAGAGRAEPAPNQGET